MPQQNADRLHQLWYSGSWWYLLLTPLSAVFAILSALRRALFRLGLFRSFKIDAPVIVVGNITVGGTGKTPVTIWLAEQLRGRGFNPGVVSRGYGGRAGKMPVQANSNSDAEIVGDEPLLIAQRSKVPVVVCPDRVAAAEELLRLGVDVVITDDGLQHYRLQRDFEIAVIDGVRGFGNGWLLPAGPLREGRARLESVNRVLVHQGSRESGDKESLGCPPEKTSSFHLVNHHMVRVDGTEARSFDEFRGETVHAIGAIGHPERFFVALENRGLNVIRHPFADHAHITARDLAYDDTHDIVMTEKDAVKCREFASARHWYVPVNVDMHDADWLDALASQLRQTQRLANT